MFYKVKFILSKQEQFLNLEPKNIDSSLTNDDVLSKMKNKYKKYTEDQINVVKQVLKKFPDAQDIEFIEDSVSEKKSNGSALLVLAFVLAVLFAPLVILIFGKKIFGPTFKSPGFRRFKIAVVLLGFCWLAICIAAIVIGACVKEVSLLIQVGLYSLFGVNIVYIILVFVFGNKLIKKIELMGDDYQIEERKPLDKRIIILLIVFAVGVLASFLIFINANTGQFLSPIEYYSALLHGKVTFLLIFIIEHALCFTALILLTIGQVLKIRTPINVGSILGILVGIIHSAELVLGAGHFSLEYLHIYLVYEVVAACFIIPSVIFIIFNLKNKEAKID